jgi:D-alanyl-D-alanine endopeptidase (penicillin-binding protein 7)
MMARWRRSVVVLLGVGWLLPGPGLEARGASGGFASGASAGSTAATRSAQAPVKPVKASAGRTTPKKRYSANRARLARARAAQQQREAREAMMPRFKVDEHGQTVPDLRAEAAIIYNPVTHEVLWEENATGSRSIASITKVMTAVVFLEHEFDLDREVVVDPADVRGASTTFLRGRERLSLDDLLHLTLIASDNAAARTLARYSLWGPDGFVPRMNEKAVELGLTSTRYADPSGLDPDNVSSAYDMARLIAYAAGDERIAAIMRKGAHTLRTSQRMITVRNTNKLVGTDVEVVGGKTGFIRKAGYCLATLLRLPQAQDPVAVVVLGARSNAGRFWETRRLLNWLAGRSDLLFGASRPTAQSQPQ